MFRALVEHGIAPYPFLYGTPSWAADKDRRKCSGPVCAIYAPKSAQTRAQFAAFAGAAADRYGVDGDFWKAPSSAVTGLVTNAPAEDPPPPTADCPSRSSARRPPPHRPRRPPPPPPTEPPCGCSEAHPITTWQVWNEQNSPKYFAPEAKPNQYAKLVRDTGTRDPRRRPERRGRPRRDVGTELGAARRDAGREVLQALLPHQGHRAELRLDRDPSVFERGRATRSSSSSRRASTSTRQVTPRPGSG